ncbi:MAG: hypothetical protein FWD90_12150 [Defluviitaleaceae bacterium]|nr:hypothetical protein [Defluviitaleaceae bacterium]
MNVEQKLDYFTAAILDEAEAVKRKASRDRSAYIEAAVSLALGEAETRINERVRERIHEIKKTRYKRIAAATADERMKLEEKRKSLMEGLHAETEERLRVFAASGAYEGYIKEAMHSASRRKGFAVMQLMRRDMGIIAPQGFTAEASDVDFIGGLIMYNAKRTKRLDLSFKTLAAKKMDSFHEDID